MAVDETCPVCSTAEIVCGKWTLLLVRDLSEGRSRFCELERSLAGISPRTLSLRLRALEEQEIVERHTFPEVPPRVEYALTEKGRALLPIIDDMRSYGERVARTPSAPSGCPQTRPADRIARAARAGAPKRSAIGEREVSAPCIRAGFRQRSRSSSDRRPRTCRRRSTAGAEVGFELGSKGGRRGRGGPQLYTYHALTGQFIAERESELEAARGPHRGRAAAGGLRRARSLPHDRERALGAIARRPRGKGQARTRAAIRALLADVFDEQTDFEVHPERLSAALERLERSELAEHERGRRWWRRCTGSRSARPSCRWRRASRSPILTRCRKCRLRVGSVGEGERGGDHLVVALTVRDEEGAVTDGPARDAIAQGCEVLKDLLRALRLFGDGRVALGALAWSRVGDGAWNPLALADRRKAPRDAGGDRRAGGRAARLLQPGLSPRAPRQRARLGGEALRARVRARELLTRR